ncbi:MAG: hypothetical protein ACE5DK_02960 [Paracoccaceae bacterium]
MNEQGAPHFLDVRTYRRKRLIDAARILPVLGAGALLFPLVFFFLEPGDENMPVLIGIYLFAVWLVLIVLTFVLSRWLQGSTD